MRNLGTLGDHFSAAFAVSADGRVVVGSSKNSINRLRPFRWTVSGGMQDLGSLPSGENGEAEGVSADGSVVVGVAVLFAFGTRGTGYTRHEDINKDGTVDDADLLIVLFNFGSGC